MSSQLDRKLIQKRAELKTLQQKYELNNKKIKLLRKQNQDLKSSSQKQSQTDTTLLLQSKQLSDVNSKLQQTIQQLQQKLHQPEIDIQNVPQFITIANLTVNSQTLEVDIANKEVGDQEFMELAPFGRIESMLLDGNKLGNGSVSMIMSNMKNIKKLLLNSNNFDVTAIVNLPALKNLKVLQLNNNLLGDQCLQYIGKLQNLTQLSLSKNKLTDIAVQNMSSLTNLTYLDISNNQITDQGTKIIIKLDKLTHLYIGWNKLSYLGVRWLIKDLKLDALDARYNTLNNQEKQKVKGEKLQKLQLFC